MSGSFDVFTHPPRPVRLDAVEGELYRLWHHPDHVGEGRARLTRACRSNLLVLCSSHAEAEQVERELPTLVQYQPCRILLFVQDENDRSNNVETEVSTYIGEERHVLAEQVTIRAGAAAVRRLQTVAPTLLVGGLQTALWWIPQGAPPRGELFRGLSQVAHQVVYDSFGWTDAARGAAAMADWIITPPVDKALFDLGWHRLNPWRQMLNEALDPSAAGEATRNLQSLTIEHGIGAVALAWLFGAWFAQTFGLRLGTTTFNTKTQMDRVSKATGKALTVNLRPVSQPHCEIASVDVSWSEGALTKAAHFHRARPDRQMVVYQSATGYSQAIMLPSVPRPIAVARQLASPARDTNFIDALMLARRIGQSLLK